MQTWPSSVARWTLECEQVKAKPLTREQWEELTGLVFKRDQKQAWIRQDRLRAKMPLSQVPAIEACVARFLDPSGSGICYGRLTFNHCHERGKAAMQKKAPDDEKHLVTVCEGHHGLARVAGFSWATSKDGIEKQQTYLEALYPELEG